MLPLCTGSEDVHIRCPRVLRGWFQSVMKVALSCDLVAAEDGGHARDDHHKGAVRHFRSGGKSLFSKILTLKVTLGEGFTLSLLR